MSNSKKDFKAIIVIVLAFLLAVVFRNDPWWGQETQIVLGWLNKRMLYYLVIWGAGYALVAYTVLKVWKEPKDF